MLGLVLGLSLPALHATGWARELVCHWCAAQQTQPYLSCHLGHWLPNPQCQLRLAYMDHQGSACVIESRLREALLAQACERVHQPGTYEPVLPGIQAVRGVQQQSHGELGGAQALPLQRQRKQGSASEWSGEGSRSCQLLPGASTMAAGGASWDRRAMR